MQQAFFILFTCGRRYQARTCGFIAIADSKAFKNLSFWRPLVMGSIRGSIKRSPIVENSLCPFSPMQHRSVYLTMSHESNWHPSEWTISVCFDSETASDSAGRRLGQCCQMSDGLFSISVKGYFKTYWKSWAWLLCREKLKFYDECCDQLLLSGEPNSGYIGILSMGGLKNRSMRLRGTVTKAFVLLDVSSNVIRCSALDSKSAGVVILQTFFDSPTIHCHNQRDEFIFHLINIIYNCFFSAQTKTLTKL